MRAWVLLGYLSQKRPQHKALSFVQGTIGKELVPEIASPLPQAPAPPFLAKATSLTQVSSSLLWSNNMHLERLLLKFW